MKRIMPFFLLFLLSVPTVLIAEEDYPIAEAIPENEQAGGFAKKKGLINRTEVKLLNRILAKNLPRTIDFEKMDIDVWPHYFGTEIQYLTLSENPDFLDIPAYSKPWAVMAESVSMRMNPFPLFIGRIQINELIVEKPVIQLAQKADGGVSLMDIMNGKRGPLLGWVRIRQMLVHQGKLRFYDEMAASHPADLELDMLEVQIDNFSVKKEFGLAVQARAPGAEERNLTVRGKAGPLTKEFDVPNMNLALDVNLKNTPIEPYLAYVPPELPAYPKSARIDFIHRLTGNLNKGVNVHGRLDVKDLVLASSDGKKETDPFDVTIDLGEELTARLLNDYISFKDLLLSVKDTTMYVSGRLDDLRGKMTWDLNARSDNIIVEDMIGLNPLPIALLPQGFEMFGKMSMELNTRGNLDMINASGKMDMTGVRFDYAEFFRKTAGNLLALDFTAEVDPVNTLFSVNGDFRFEHGEVLAMNFFAETLRSLAQRTGKRGLHSLALEIDGLPVSFEDMKGKVRFSGATLPGYEEAKESDMFVHLEGMKMTNIGNSKSSGHSALLDGAVDLDNELLDLKCTMIYSPEISQKIIKLIGTSMYEVKDGQVYVPVSVKGSLEDPEIKVLR